MFSFVHSVDINPCPRITKNGLVSYLQQLKRNPLAKEVGNMANLTRAIFKLDLYTLRYEASCCIFKYS